MAAILAIDKTPIRADESGFKADAQPFAFFRLFRGCQVLRLVGSRADLLLLQLFEADDFAV